MCSCLRLAFAAITISQTGADTCVSFLFSHFNTSKIFRCLFSVQHLHYLRFRPLPCALLYLFDFFTWSFLLSPFDLLKWLILRFYALCKPKNMHFYAVWCKKSYIFLHVPFFIVPLPRFFNLIISLLCPTFMQVIACSEFLLVPFRT